MTRFTCIVTVVIAGTLTAAVPDAGAQTLSRAELQTLAVTASTADEHRTLAAHYRTHAADHDADAALHEQIAAARRKEDGDEAWDLARDAAHYATHSREAAEALRDLAALHEARAEKGAPAKKGCCAKDKAEPPPAAGPPHDH